MRPADGSPEALDVRVRHAVSLLVDARSHEDGEQPPANEMYRGAVAVMMRILFLSFAEERGLLPESSTGDLLADLEARPANVDSGAWPRLLGIFEAVHHVHGGSLFDPASYGWLPRSIDDRLVQNLLRSVRALRSVDVEQIGYVYEGLLASRLRKTSGTHYTPRMLAEEIVEGALEPLVYEPGPLQTADPQLWVPRSSAEILSLKVADIAMGSGVFLVAAARYLAGHLTQAWRREGAPSDVDADFMVISARRAVIEHCLYGVDIDPMAADLAKLSLWLVSMTPGLPFTFVDHRLAVGDSLLGAGNWAAVVGEAGRDARLEGPRTDRATAYADLVAGSRVAAAKAGRRERRRITERVGALADDLAASENLAEAEDLATVREIARGWLATDNPDRGIPRTPLHWPLAFPEVFATGQGGFDAIIGNPPFLGGQRLTGTLGKAYREYLVNSIGRGARGSADLVAYFALRAHDLLNDSGQTGLIATNTLAQGDTREVGLDQIEAGGTTIRRAVKSRPWASRSAILEYCAVWTSRLKPGVDAQYTVDGQPAAAITTSLDPASATAGTPYRLGANRGLCFIGSYVLGMGFTLGPDAASALIAKDDRNREVLFPYLGGQDLNARPDRSASRWVINFHDWPQDRAQRYPDCFEQVLRLVKPDRETNNRKVRRDRWWQFAERAPNLYEAIAGLDRVIAITLVSRTLQPVLVATGQVFAHKLAVFATDDPGLLGVLSSAPHYWWARRRTSTRGIGNAPNYSPSDAFETLPLPPLSDEVRRLGARLDDGLRAVMLARRAGLTTTVNLVNDPTCRDEDVVALRRTYREIDEAICRAYGWDIRLDHDFHDLGRETRYTVGPAARLEIVDRLLELNHQRHADAERARPVD